MGRKQVAEIEVMRQKDAPLCAGLLQDLRVAQSIEALLVKMCRPMPETLKEVDDDGRNAHVREEPHGDVDSSG